MTLVVFLTVGWTGSSDGGFGVRVNLPRRDLQRLLSKSVTQTMILRQRSSDGEVREFSVRFV